MLADRRRITSFLTLLGILAALVPIGCTRRFFRNRTDQDVEAAITSKNRVPEWAVENWYIYPDARSRFADFDDRDFPKKPIDDPAAALFAPDPQPIRGHLHRHHRQRQGTIYLDYLAHWNEENRRLKALVDQASATESADSAGSVTHAGGPAGTESPGGYTASRPSTGGVTTASTGIESIDRALQSNEPPFLVTLEQACELALFNSRDYMDRREDLYVSAIPVTQERFNFMAQVFGTEQAVRQWGASNTGSPGSLWQLNSTGTINQLLPTGATIVAQLANRLVIDLSNNRPTVGISNLTLELTQPLLRGGGWAATLEPLTQAERNLVYGMRSYARFRKNFYVYMAGGTDVFNSPYAYAGLNLRGVGPNLGAPSQGYLPTLLSAAQERNERQNLQSLAGFLEVFRQYQGKGDFSELQVGQVEQQLLRGQSTLLQRRQELQNGIDSFKLQLGVPTSLPLELEDGPTRPIQDMLQRFDRLQADFKQVRSEAESFASTGYRDPLSLLTGAMITTVPIEVPLRTKLEDLMFRSALVRGTKTFKDTIDARWTRWKLLGDEPLRQELDWLRKEIRALQLKQMDLERQEEKLPADQVELLDRLPRDLAIGELEAALRSYEVARKRRAVTARELNVRYEETINAFAQVVGEARKERRDEVRAAWPNLPMIQIDGIDLVGSDLDRSYTLACQTALTNRLELMNARGQLVDSWRRIAVQANSLLGVLNVGYAFNSDSPDNANLPIALGGSRSQHQLILNGELPLVRRVERNNYRIALITYQRNRRNLQATEDFILNDVRTQLRNIRVLAENYRIQRRAVEVAFDQVENAFDVLQAPPVPDGGGGVPGRAVAQGQQQAANAAAFTQQLLNAQNSLVQAQNQLYTVWVNYLIARMTFYRDIERLPLDPRGVWIDESGTPPDCPPVDVGELVNPEQPAVTSDFAEIRR